MGLTISPLPRLVGNSFVSPRHFKGGDRRGTLLITTGPRSIPVPDGRVEVLYGVQCPCGEKNCLHDADATDRYLSDDSNFLSSRCLLQSVDLVTLEELRKATKGLGQTAGLEEISELPTERYGWLLQKGMLPPGSPKDPTTYPNWEGWTDLFGVPCWSVEEMAEKILTLGHMLHGKNPADLIRLLALDGFLAALSRRWKVGKNECVDLLLSMSPEEAAALVNDPSGPRKGTARSCEAPGITTDGCILERLRELRKAAETLEGFWSNQEFVRASEIDHISLLWKALSHGGTKLLKKGMKEAVPMFRDSFLREWEGAERYVRRYHGDWMVAHIVWKSFEALKRDRILFNLGEPGIGKSRTVFALAMEHEFRNVLVLATKSTLDKFTNRERGRERTRQWEAHARIVGEGDANFLFTDCDDLEGMEEGKRNYVFVSEYDVQNNPDGLVKRLAAIGWDMMVVDELQNWTGSKGLDDALLAERKKEGNRFRNLSFLRKSMPPECLFYLMTATLMRISLREAYRMLELFTGKKYTSMDDDASAALKLRYETLSRGSRFYIRPSLLPPPKAVDWKPTGTLVFEQHGQEDGADSVGTRITTTHYLLGESLLSSLPRTTKPTPQAECVLIKGALKEIEDSPLLMRLLRKASRPILYTHFVDGPVALLAGWARKKLGRRAYLYTGELKQLDMMERDPKCVIVASAPMTTGIDGIHKISDMEFIFGMPWHYAQLEQFARRIVRPDSAFMEGGVLIVNFVADNIPYSHNRNGRVLGRKKTHFLVMNADVPRELRREVPEAEVRKMLDNQRKLAGMSIPLEDAPAGSAEPQDKKFWALLHRLTDRTHNLYSNSDSAKLLARREGDFLARGKEMIFLPDYERENEEFEGRNGNVRDVYLNYVLPTTGRRILDIGCGTTGPAEAYRLGLDGISFADPFLSKQACQRFPEVEARDRNATGYGDSSFDLIVSCLSMFAKNRRNSVLEMARLLAPGGMAVIREPHGRRWVRGLDALLEKAGLIVESQALPGTGMMEIVARKKLEAGSKKRSKIQRRHQ